MGTFYLGPLEARDIEEIRCALVAQLEFIDDCIENGPVLTVDETGSILAEQRRVSRLIDVCESLMLKN